MAGRGKGARKNGTPLVGVVGGSKTDFPVLEKAVAVLTSLGIPSELRVVSFAPTRTRMRLATNSENGTFSPAISIIPFACAGSTGAAIRRRSA